MDPQGIAFYLSLIDKAPSYHDLVIVRARYFGLLERTLTKQECQTVKDRWQARAKDDSLPVAPPRAVTGGDTDD